MAADASVPSKPPATTNINIIHEGISTDRSRFTPQDVIADIWASLGLPAAALSAVDLPGSENAGPVLPSSYRIGCLAQSSIALSALSAALVHSVRGNASVEKEKEKAAAAASLPRITVPQRHATAEFLSVQHCSIVNTAAPANDSPKPPVVPLLDIHPTADGGRIRIHTAFPHHRDGALRLLGLDPAAYRAGNLTRADVDAQTRQWRSRDLEAAGLAAGCAMYALRSYDEWDVGEEAQASAVADLPVQVRRIGSGGVGGGAAAAAPAPAGQTPPVSPPPRRGLSNLRILELTRVIAGPVAGRTLAAHGADVLWVTAPHLPALPVVDRDVARGKRTAQLDLRREGDREQLRKLIASCDVFLQGYRPGSLAARGWEEEDLVRMNPGIVVANMSAFGPEGPWRGRRGFDSLVQTCSGMNVSEAEHFNGGEEGEVARVLPCQALDHASGYLLATGICAALYKREVEGGGGAFSVDVSLAGTMKYLRSLGQYEGRSGFDCAGFTADEVEGYLEVRESRLGLLKAVRHSASVEGFEPGWDRMPKPLGSDEAEWQS